MTSKSIEINYEIFLRLYKRAVKEKKDSFTYNGEEFSTAYAKYLIEYIKTRE